MSINVGILSVASVAPVLRAIAMLPGSGKALHRGSSDEVSAFGDDFGASVGIR